MKQLAGSVLFMVFFAIGGNAQQVASIEFHLYTDSLKKGVYNYINIDGKLGDGSWRPLNSKVIQFSSNTGKWDGNSLIIDSAYNKDSVVVTAVMKENPALQKKVTIYMKKNLADPQLKTEEELMKEWDNSNGKSRRKRGN